MIEMYRWEGYEWKLRVIPRWHQPPGEPFKIGITPGWCSIGKMVFIKFPCGIENRLDQRIGRDGIPRDFSGQPAKLLCGAYWHDCGIEYVRLEEWPADLEREAKGICLELEECYEQRRDDSNAACHRRSAGEDEPEA